MTTETTMAMTWVKLVGRKAACKILGREVGSDNFRVRLTEDVPTYPSVHEDPHQAVLIGGGWGRGTVLFVSPDRIVTSVKTTALDGSIRYEERRGS